MDNAVGGSDLNIQSLTTICTHLHVSPMPTTQHELERVRIYFHHPSKHILITSRPYKESASTSTTTSIGVSCQDTLNRPDSQIQQPAKPTPYAKTRSLTETRLGVAGFSGGLSSMVQPAHQITTQTLRPIRSWMRWTDRCDEFSEQYKRMLQSRGTLMLIVGKRTDADACP